MISERVYRALLVLYPVEHRREYEEPMVQLFRDRMRRDGSGLRTLWVWTQMVLDLAGSVLTERRQAALLKRHRQGLGLWGTLSGCLACERRQSTLNFIEKAGLALVVVGLGALAGYGLYAVMGAEDVPLIVRVALSTAAAGLMLVVVAVLVDRLRSRKAEAFEEVAY